MNGHRTQFPPGRLEHRYELVREWAVDGLSLLVAAATIVHTDPRGILAAVVTFIGTYVIARFFSEVLWRSSLTWLCLLTGLIYLCTLVQAFNAMPVLPALLLTLFLPGIGQAYLLWALWPATSSLLHPLPLLCLAWVAMFAIWVFEPGTFRRLTTGLRALRTRR